MKKSIHRLRAILASLVLVTSSQLVAIECEELELVTEALLHDHYVHRHYDDALCQRILDRLFIELDPGKLIFNQADITEFKTAFGNDIDIWLFARSCGFLDAIRERYFQRTAERMDFVRHWLPYEHDYTLDEHFQHARYRDYLSSPDELKERWRKQIQ